MKEDDINEGFWVFVSHSTKDFEKVRLVRNALEDSGFRPILFYLKCLEKETEVNDLLKREIDARKRFILCDSPNAQASKFVQSEVSYIQSKKRMFEIIDLSQINMSCRDAEKIVTELIKPFRKRTNVFVCCAHEDRNLLDIVKEKLTLQGFKTVDISPIDSQSAFRHMGGLERWIDTIRQQVVSTLENGYFLYLIGGSQSYFIQEEIECAFDFAPNMILPIVIKNPGMDKMPQFLIDKNYINVCNIVSDEEKANVIVDALIEFDLKNNK